MAHSHDVPADLTRIFSMLRERVPGADGVIFSTHNHDDLGLAVANTLAALDAGLKERPEDDPLQAGLGAAYKRLGELGMENELLREKIARMEGGAPFHRARSRK